MSKKGPPHYGLSPDFWRGELTESFPSKLYGYLRNQEEGLADDKYDGDEDIEDQQEGLGKKRKKKTGGGKSKASHCIKLKGDKDGSKTNKLQYLVRDVIFYIGKQEASVR